MKKSLYVSTFLRCILHQAIKLEVLLPNIQRLLESLFTTQFEPITSELEDLFLQVCRNYKNCFLLIDGLDEADETEQRNVKFFLKEVQKVDCVRILATTHAALDLSKVLTGGLVLHIKSENLNDDINTFVESQIKKYSQDKLSSCSPYALQLIKQKLTFDAEGM
jgi:hypothetical protein